MNSILPPFQASILDRKHSAWQRPLGQKFEPRRYDYSYGNRPLRDEDTSDCGSSLNTANRIEEPKSTNEVALLHDCNGYEVWAGTNGNDLIIGSDDKTNFIYASWGNDIVNGGDCIDHIAAGPGLNLAHGGTGGDRFYLGKFEKTTILDFQPGEDKIVVSSGIMSNALPESKNGKSGDIEGIKVVKGDCGDAVIEAKINGSCSYFYLQGVSYDDAIKENSIYKDIYLLGEQKFGVENIEPLLG